MMFGDDASGDFGLGLSDGGVGTGGIYAFDLGEGNIILGVQPTGSDFTPGDFVLRFDNSGGAISDQLHVSYTIWCLNNSDRASSWSFAYAKGSTSEAESDAIYVPVPALTLITPLDSDPMPSWHDSANLTTLTDLAATTDEYIYLKWTSDDVGGSGTRDECGLDAVVLSVPQ